MTVYAVVDGLIPACIYGSLNFAGTINIPRISQQWNKRPSSSSPRTGIEQEPIESSTVLFCEDAVGLLLFSGPNRRYPWKQKLAIVRLFCLKLHWSTFFHRCCLLPVIHLIHLGHQSCLNKNLLIPGVPLKMSFISFCPPLPVRFPPRQKPLLILTLNF